MERQRIGSLVLAVILSEAKDPKGLDITSIARTFQATISGQRCFAGGEASASDAVRRRGSLTSMAPLATGVRTFGFRKVRAVEVV